MAEVISVVEQAVAATLGIEKIPAPPPGTLFALVDPNGLVTDVRPLGERFDVSAPFRWIAIPAGMPVDPTWTYKGNFIKPVTVLPETQTAATTPASMRRENAKALLKAAMAGDETAMDRLAEIIGGGP
jgi:hypothetical protein